MLIAFPIKKTLLSKFNHCGFRFWIRKIPARRILGRDFKFLFLNVFS